MIALFAALPSELATLNMQILMSTVNARFDPARAGVSPSVFVVVNQIIPGWRDTDVRSYDRDATREFAVFDQQDGRGLARSRNRAIDLASDEICLFGDDDQIYVPNVCRLIEGAFERFPDADIITFTEKTSPGPEGVWRKPYPRRRRAHNLFSAGKVRSPEIAFRVSRVREVGLRMDEVFGPGATYISGEEFAFLVDALRKGLRVMFVPELISFNPMNSTASRGATDTNVMYSKGAMMKKVFGKLAPLAICAFAAKKMYQRRTLSPTLLVQMFRSWADYKPD